MDTSDISMTLLIDVLLPGQLTFRKCPGCKDDSESHKNVTLEMSFFALRLKEENKATEKSRETAVH